MVFHCFFLAFFLSIIYIRILYYILYCVYFVCEYDTMHLLYISIYITCGKATFSTSVGWYINNLLVNEMFLCLFVCVCKLKSITPEMLLSYFYHKVLSARAAVFYRNVYGFFTVLFCSFPLSAIVSP